MILEDRLEKVRGTKRSNCIGTALYLVGERQRDVSGDIYTIYQKQLQYLMETTIPLYPGTLVSWNQKSRFMDVGFIVWHLAVLSNLDPLTIHHRDGCNQPFEENVLFEEVQYNEDHDFLSLHFYLPKSVVNFLKPKY